MCRHIVLAFTVAQDDIWVGYGLFVPEPDPSEAFCINNSDPNLKGHAKQTQT